MIAADMAERAAEDMSPDAVRAGGRFRQDHTVFLAVLVMANVCLDLIALRPDGVEEIAVFWGGMLMTQTFLMGLWLAFGGLHPLWRAFLVTSITLGGTLAASISVGPSFGGVWGAFLQLAPVAGTIMFATHALLLPLRLLMSWRIDFNPAYHMTGSNRCAQFRLLDCLGLMTAVALPLALARLLDSEWAKIAAIFGGSALLSSLPIVYLIVVPRRSDKTWRASVTMSGICVVAEYFVFRLAFNDAAGLLLPCHSRSCCHPADEPRAVAVLLRPAPLFGGARLKPR